MALIERESCKVIKHNDFPFENDSAGCCMGLLGGAACFQSSNLINGGVRGQAVMYEDLATNTLRLPQHADEQVLRADISLVERKRALSRQHKDRLSSRRVG